MYVGLKNSGDSESLSNYFSLERYSENSPHKDFSFFTEDVAHNTEAAVNYLIFNDESTVSVNRIFEINPNTENESPTYLLPEDDLPDGAVVEVKGRLLCMVSGGRCLTKRAFTRTFQGLADDCQSIAKGLSFFNCGKRSVATCSDQIYGQSASGTCINPETHEKCNFTSTYTTDIAHNQGWGAYDRIDCNSCGATHQDSDWGGNPSTSTDCTPTDCIGGCPGRNQGNSLIALIAGGVAGGVVLIGTVATIATVISCLVYKHKRRSGYQDL